MEHHVGIPNRNAKFFELRVRKRLHERGYRRRRFGRHPTVRMRTVRKFDRPLEAFQILWCYPNRLGVSTGQTENPNRELGVLVTVCFRKADLNILAELERSGKLRDSGAIGRDGGRIKELRICLQFARRARTALVILRIVSLGTHPGRDRRRTGLANRNGRADDGTVFRLVEKLIN